MEPKYDLRGLILKYGDYLNGREGWLPQARRLGLSGLLGTCPTGGRSLHGYFTFERPELVATRYGAMSVRRRH